MNVLSLFNGMGCIWIALDRLGIKIDKRYSSEIDKFANKANDINYPNTIQLGDVTKWREWNIEWDKIDLIGAGSPCQGFSFAGKQLAFNDPRSALFFVFVDILNYCRSKNPNVLFLLENVVMKKQHQRVINQTLGMQPVLINSALVSAQNRRRLYWSNIRTCKVGLFGDVYTDIPQPKDKGILLRDILESEVDEKYYLSDAVLNRMFKENPKINPDKSYSVQTHNNTQSGGHSRTASLIKIDKQGNIKQNQDKSDCFTAGGHSDGNHSDMDLIVEASIKFGRSEEGKEIRKKSMQKGIDYTPFQAKEIIDIDFNKTGTITTATTKDNLIIQLNPSKESRGKQPYQHNRIYSDEGKITALDLDSQRKKTYTNSRIRRLTPIECCRLQTVPDSYFFKEGKYIISESQVYKCLGNGWTVDVICHILSYI